MALARVLARAAQGHALIEHAPVAHFRGLADDDSAAVVDHDALAQLRRGVYLHPRAPARVVGDELCKRHKTFEIGAVGDAIGGKRLISRISVLHRPLRGGGGILVHHRVQVRAFSLADLLPRGYVSLFFSHIQPYAAAGTKAPLTSFFFVLSLGLFTFALGVRLFRRAVALSVCGLAVGVLLLLGRGECGFPVRVEGRPLALRLSGLVI